MCFTTPEYYCFSFVHFPGRYSLHPCVIPLLIRVLPHLSPLHVRTQCIFSCCCHIEVYCCQFLPSICGSAARSALSPFLQTALQPYLPPQWPPTCALRLPRALVWDITEIVLASFFDSDSVTTILSLGTIYPSLFASTYNSINSSRPFTPTSGEPL